jgi:hypothetical protein
MTSCAKLLVVHSSNHSSTHFHWVTYVDQMDACFFLPPLLLQMQQDGESRQTMYLVKDVKMQTNQMDEEHQTSEGGVVSIG